MSTLPQLTDKVTAHQTQLLQTLNDNSEFFKLTTNVIKEVQRNQTTSDDRITLNLFIILHGIAQVAHGKNQNQERKKYYSYNCQVTIQTTHFHQHN
jgi:hypothetical protein